MITRTVADFGELQKWAKRISAIGGVRALLITWPHGVESYPCNLWGCTTVEAAAYILECERGNSKSDPPAILGVRPLDRYLDLG